MTKDPPRSITEDELVEAAKRLDAERREQGLPEAITDPAALGPVARWLDRGCEP